MKLTKKNRSYRAKKLTKEVEGLIETGGFTPEYGYLQFQIGPCGCALAAAATLAGVDQKKFEANVGPFGAGKVAFLQKSVKGASIATVSEMKLFESGYENGLADECFTKKDMRNSFFKAGVKLRRYHPFVQGKVEV